MTATTKILTEDDIAALLMRNDEAVGRALVALLDRQTTAEQNSGQTQEWNGRGFSGFDGGPMTGMARDFITRGYLTPRQLNWLRSGTEKRPKPRIAKYTKQLLEIANEKNGASKG